MLVSMGESLGRAYTPAIDLVCEAVVHALSFGFVDKDTTPFGDSLVLGGLVRGDNNHSILESVGNCVEQRDT